MKKLLLSLVLGLAFASILQARHNRGCCPERKPVCTKTIMVEETIKVPKCVEVPAKKILIPQPDVCERIPQPDKVVYHKQEPCVRWECPAECD